SEKLGVTALPNLRQNIQIRAEERQSFVAASISDGSKSYSTPIVDLRNVSSGSVGLLQGLEGGSISFRRFEVRQSPKIAEDGSLDRKLYDARGADRGELRGPGWDDYGRNKLILLNSYRPEKLPSNQDWVLILHAESD